ncbi:MAG TPA: ChaB family protein [Chloroflexota bacterium]|nr:ChaB family protein [Chloroflexota bacterium]
MTTDSEQYLVETVPRATPSTDSASEPPASDQSNGHDPFSALSQLQRQMIDTIRNPQAAREAWLRNVLRESGGPSSNGQNPSVSPPGLTLSISPQDLRTTLTAILDTASDDLFSPQLKEAIEKRFGQMSEALTAGMRKAKVPAAAMKETQPELDRIRGDLVEAMFSESLRRQFHEDAELAVAAVLGGDLPSARQSARTAMQSLVQRRADIMASHYEQLYETSLRAAVAGIQEKLGSSAKPETHERTQPDGKAADNNGSRASAQPGAMPDTLKRSPKAAQTVWQRAYDRAAREQGEGRKAERAAFQVLREQYEKKGDRWVKKAS